MCDVKLDSVQCVKDMGVQSRQTLKTHHCNDAAN